MEKQNKRNLHLESIAGCPFCDNGHKEYEIIEEVEILSEGIRLLNIKDKISNTFKNIYYHMTGIYHFHAGY